MYIRYGIGIVCGKVNDLKKKKNTAINTELIFKDASISPYDVCRN